MSDYHVKRAAEIIQTIQYATVATVTAEGHPWNSPVARVFDDQANIYWFSDKNNQHSKNVRTNGEAFIVIYDSTVPEGKGEGVYMRAKVEELTDPDQIRAVRRIKKGADYEGQADEFMGDALRRVYKATPVSIWMNDAEVTDGVFIRDFRADVPIEELRSLLKSV